MRFAAFRRNPLPRHRRRATEVVRRQAGVSRASLLATPMTLRRVPLARSRTVSPRPAPSVPLGHPRVVALPAPRCRSAEVARSESDPRLRGLAPRTSPLRPTPLRAPGRSFLPWACFPFVVRLPPQPPWTFQGRPETPRKGNRAAGPLTVAIHRDGAEDIPPMRSAEAAAGVCPEGSCAPGPEGQGNRPP
jgi:hypothetical protein